MNWCMHRFIYHIEAETKWPQTTYTNAFIFLNENLSISNKISLKYVPYGLTDNAGSDNGLAPKGKKAIKSRKDGIKYWYKYVSLSLNKLI